MLLKIKDFGKELEKLFASTKEAGSVNISFKRLGGNRLQKVYKNRDDLEKPTLTETRCIVHAKTSKHKISTLVSSSEIIAFQSMLREILRENMNSLQKKEKKGKKKTG